MRISLIQFGRVLTDRPFGKAVMAQLEPTLIYPVELDFTGVLSLGSSFGDEVVAAIAKKQGNQIRVLNPNTPVKACLSQIAEQQGIAIEVVTPRTEPATS